MYGYIYLTTNLINNKRYIGQHKSPTYDHSYIGSGRVFSKAVDKYGKHNFSVEYLCECESKEELDAMEEHYINIYNAVNDPNFYNVSSGGYRRGNRGLVSMYNPSTDEIILSPRSLVSLNFDLGFIEGSRPRTNESKERYRNSKKDLVPMTDGVKTIYVHKDNVDEAVSNGYRLGRIATRPNQKEEKRKWVNKDGKSLMVKGDEVDAYLSDGYSLGRVKFEHFNRVAPPHNLGKKLIKKGDDTMWVSIDDLDKYIVDGWKKVRKR